MIGAFTNDFRPDCYQTFTVSFRQVYIDLDRKPEMREFTAFRTCMEMYEELTEEIPGLLYHRLPMSDDAAPSEEVRRLSNLVLCTSDRVQSSSLH